MKVFCILSDERALRSKSPSMHNAVLRRTGIPGVYVPFQVRHDRVRDAVLGLKALNIAGANVTVPYKETVIPFLDSLSDEAAALGAVNTIVRRDERLEGHNTDAPGFLDALEECGFDPSGKSALVIGTGGAARAVVYALGLASVGEIVLAGRDVAKADRLRRNKNARAVSIRSLADEWLTAELVVNATSVSSPQEAPEMADLVRRLEVDGCRLVADLNYGRADNMWEQFALSRRIQFTDGLAMLAHQARRSFTLWTGVEVEAEAFKQALREPS